MSAEANKYFVDVWTVLPQMNNSDPIVEQQGQPIR
jgi:hypothetical protein